MLQLVLSIKIRLHMHIITLGYILPIARPDLPGRMIGKMYPRICLEGYDLPGTPA